MGPSTAMVSHKGVTTILPEEREEGALNRKDVWVKVVILMVLTGTLLHTKVETREDKVVVEASVKEVRDFMADFSNMNYLNPFLFEFHILEEAKDTEAEGLEEAWQYKVQYSEQYETIPLLTNTATAEYKVYQEPSSEDLVISSEHTTCLLPLSMWCLVTQAHNRFRSLGPHTQVQEVVNFSCPWLLLPICWAEIESQRTKVLDNLRKAPY